MEQTNGKGESRNNDTLNLASSESIRDDNTGDDHLNDGELGDGGHSETILHLLSFGGRGGGIHRGLWGITWHLLCIEKIMWYLVGIPFVLICHDFMKLPVDRLYFHNWKRPFVGMRNTLIDIIAHSPTYSPWKFKGLWLIKSHYKQIREEFEEISKTLEKTMYHDVDPWFDKNDNYYRYSFDQFPKLKSLVRQIPSIEESTASFAVMDTPMTLSPHRAETNHLLRYHLTILGNGDCTLYTERGPHVHREGQDFLFDHSRYHEVIKTGYSKRVVLILDVKRF